MLCVGRSIGVLLLGRVLQGVSASVVWVVGLTMVADTVGPADGTKLLTSICAGVRFEG